MSFAMCYFVLPPGRQQANATITPAARVAVPTALLACAVVCVSAPRSSPGPSARHFTRWATGSRLP